MTLISILLATLLGGVVSVLLAAAISMSWLPRLADRLIAFSVGLLLAFAFTDLIPEALHEGLDARHAGLVLIAGLFSFFLLERVALWRHDHGTSLGHHTHHPRVAMVVLGDGIHNFVDGILISAAFLADPALGWTTALAVFAHEVPQELSDFVLLLSSGMSRARALALNALSGLGMVAGGVLGYVTLKEAQAAVPFVLVVSAASFIYIAMVDLVPELHKSRTTRASLTQGVLLLLGVLVVIAIGEMLPHGH